MQPEKAHSRRGGTALSSRPQGRAKRPAALTAPAAKGSFRVYRAGPVVTLSRMSEIAEFVKHGAAKVTPALLEETVRKLPLWKAGFTQIDAPELPHLRRQLEFLADVVEDVHGGANPNLPYHALAAAVFALQYAADEFDLIPDAVEGVGRADDSSVVRAALIMHEKAFSAAATTMGRDWASITTDP